MKFTNKCQQYYHPGTSTGHILDSNKERLHPSASDSVVFLRHCALYKFTYLAYLLTY